MFFKKKLTRSDEEITIKETFRIKSLEDGQLVETIVFDILTNQPVRKIGYCDLRNGMSFELEYYGQVGYHVNENYRGHHYALKACKLLFECAKEIGMNSLMITCNPDNIPSRKTLEALNGTLERIVDIPVQHPCYANGERQKCIFTYQLK